MLQDISAEGQRRLDHEKVASEHRLGSARLADRIVMLEGGRIAQEGTHAQLMSMSGLYSHMIGAQAQWYS